MNLLRHIIFFILTCTILSCTGQNHRISSFNDAAKKAIDERLIKLSDSLDYKSGWAFGVVYKDSILYKNARGFRNLEKKLPFTTSSPFYIASTTKSFIALLAVKLSSIGLIDLNKTLGFYLPEVDLKIKYDEDDITILDLLTNHI